MARTFGCGAMSSMFFSVQKLACWVNQTLQTCPEGKSVCPLMEQARMCSWPSSSGIGFSGHFRVTSYLLIKDGQGTDLEHVMEYQNHPRTISNPH